MLFIIWFRSDWCIFTWTNQVQDDALLRSKWFVIVQLYKLQRRQFTPSKILPYMRSSCPLEMNFCSSNSSIVIIWNKLPFKWYSRFYAPFDIIISMCCKLFGFSVRLFFCRRFYFSHYVRYIVAHSAVKAILEFRQTHLSNPTRRTIRKTLRWRFGNLFFFFLLFFACFFPLLAIVAIFVYEQIQIFLYQQYYTYSVGYAFKRHWLCFMFAIPSEKKLCLFLTQPRWSLSFGPLDWCRWHQLIG